MRHPVPLERAHAAAGYVSRYSVALLRPDPLSPGGVHMVGSGSFVHLHGRRFILTATHVWQRLRQEHEIHYTAVSGMNHSAKLLRASLTPFSLGEIPDGKIDEWSPDVTLLELNPIDANLIETRLGFFPIGKGFAPRSDEIHQDLLVLGAPGALKKGGDHSLSFEIRGVFADGGMREETREDMGFITIVPTQDADNPIESWRGIPQIRWRRRLRDIFAWSRVLPRRKGDSLALMEVNLHPRSKDGLMYTRLSRPH